MALFDAVINNTDRKIGHLLPQENGQLFGCDHGVTFHHENKLRTVLWQWAGEKISDDEVQSLELLLSRIEQNQIMELDSLITKIEIDALIARINELISEKIFPMPSQDWPAIPWPAF
jgi:uncharacterized repeat protein (TIGR03843 family)